MNRTAARQERLQPDNFRPKADTTPYNPESKLLIVSFISQLARLLVF